MKKLNATFCLALGWLFSNSAVFGFTTITDQHIDLKISYSEGTGFSVFAATSSETAAPLRETLLFDGPTGTTGAARPDGVQWDFLGVNAGETVYVWPQTNSPGRIELGISTDSGAIPAGTFASYTETDPRVATSPTQSWLRLELQSLDFLSPAGVTEPADFSVWQVGSSLTQWMATSDGISADDLYLIQTNTHRHVAWGFTKVGYYRAVFTVSGILASTGKRVTSAPFTVHFGVESAPMALINPTGSGDGSTGGPDNGTPDGGSNQNGDGDVAPGKKPKIKIVKKSTRPTTSARHRILGTILNAGSKPKIEWSTSRKGKFKSRKVKVNSSGRGKWAVRLKLKPGRNTYFFRITDRDGNQSKPVRVRVNRVNR